MFTSTEGRGSITQTLECSNVQTPEVRTKKRSKKCHCFILAPGSLLLSAPTAFVSFLQPTFSSTSPQQAKLLLPPWPFPLPLLLLLLHRKHVPKKTHTTRTSCRPSNTTSRPSTRMTSTPEAPTASTGPTSLTLFVATSLPLSSLSVTSPPTPTPKPKTHHHLMPLSTPLSSSLSLLPNPFPIPPFPNSSTTLSLSPLGKPLATPPGLSVSTPVAAICTPPRLISSPHRSIPFLRHLSSRITLPKSILWNSEPKSHLGSSQNSSPRTHFSSGSHPFSGARPGSMASAPFGTAITTSATLSPR